MVVERKLRREIVPWLVAGRRFKHQREWKIGQVYLYGSEALTALGSIGVATPIIGAMSRVDKVTPSSHPPSP